MVDLIPFAAAFLLIWVVLIIGRNRLPRWARFALIATQAIVIFFAIAFTVLG